MTIPKKLIYSYIVIAIFPTLATTLISLHMMSNRFSEELMLKGKRSLLEAESFIINYFAQGREIAALMSGCAQIKQLLESGMPVEGLDAFKDFIGIAVVEIFDGNGALVKTIYATGRKGTVDVLTPPGAPEIDQILALKKVSRFQTCADCMAIKVGEPVIDPGTMDVIGGVIVSFPLNQVMLGYLKDWVKTDVSLFFLHSGTLISTLPGDAGRQINTMWSGGISDMSQLETGYLARNEEIAFHHYTISYNAVLDSSGRPVAILSTAINRDSIEQSRRHTYTILIFSSMAVLGIVFFIGILVARTITTPINRLLASMQLITRGDLDVHVDTHRHDELGLLARGFAHMRDAVKKQITDLYDLNKEITAKNTTLDQYRHHLEEIVKERTSELHLANQDLTCQIKERRKAEEKYRTIIENIEYGYYETDLKGNITFFNESMLDIFQRSSAQMTRANIGRFMGHNNAALFTAVCRNAADSRNGSQANLVEVQRSDGESRVIEYSCAPIKGEGDHLEGFRGVCRDVTERRQVELEMQRARQAAEESNKAKSEFIANMSHEIRTPLNAVIGFSELLSTMTLDVEHQTYLNGIEVAGKSLLTLINDILDLSKIEAGMLTIQKSPVNLEKLFEEISYIFRDKMDDKNIQFGISLDKGLPDCLKLDEARMRQILMNLVGNAVKFTENGQIRLSAKYENVANENIDLSILVADTGIGIPEKDHHRIFDAFQQRDGSSTKKHSGTGLGLSICDRLVQAMGGRITLTSTENIGSTFRIWLKNVEIAQGTKTSSCQSHPDINRTIFENKKILIVDDVASSRDLLKAMLEKVNFTVIQAGDTQAALSAIEKVSPDLVFMDIKRPVSNGKQAALTLRQHTETGELPIIALTADTMAGKAWHDLGEVFEGYLVKPFTAGEVLAELSRFFPYAGPVAAPGSGSLKKKIPPTLVEILKAEILPLAGKMQEAIVISRIENFGKRLLDLASTYEVDVLERFGRGIIAHVESCDIIEIKKDFRKLPGIVEQLEQHVSFLEND